MAQQNRARLSFNADGELKRQIDEYRFATKRDTRAEAIIALIKAGLEQQKTSDEARKGAADRNG